MRGKYFLAMWAILFSLIVQASAVEDRKLSDYAQVSVITCGTGDQLYSLFGHTGIRINDPMEGIDRIYNYGMFDFRTENFYGKFVKGDLLYFVVHERSRDFVEQYVYDNRAVYEQVLNISQAQKQEIFDKLNESLKEENKNYIYKFIDDNCTTKAVDVLNSVLPSPVKVDIEGNTETYRTILNTYLKSRYFEMLGINLIFGSKVNQECNLLFLPDKFMLGLQETVIDGQPLAPETTEVFIPQVEKQSLWWNTIWFASAIALVLALACLNRTVRRTYLFIMGLLGVFFAGVGFYSLHAELLWNNSVLLCSPLFLLIPFVSAEAKWKKAFNWAMLGSVLAFVLANIVSEKLIVSLPIVALTLFAVAVEIKLISFSRK